MKNIDLDIHVGFNNFAEFDLIDVRRQKGEHLITRLNLGSCYVALIKSSRLSHAGGRPYHRRCIFSAVAIQLFSNFFRPLWKAAGCRFNYSFTQKIHASVNRKTCSLSAIQLSAVFYGFLRGENYKTTFALSF
jgi:hypothetical protein